ncbi:MAG TPA: TdeIII family type II restriction endonuclease [Anaerolineaceae bacterium]|nr:TdeIII family type II restriction endonuclease [Anaerolineaceae bacterium]
MAMEPERKERLISKIQQCLSKKFKAYKPESEYMPFHYRLLGRDRMALFSFIQSLNTTFGVSIYEPVAIELAADRFVEAKMQIKPNRYLSSEAQRVIDGIMSAITTAERDPNSINELEEIRSVCQLGEPCNVKLRNYDIYLKTANNVVFCMDIKTVKPNIGNFEDYKRMLLLWAAAEMYVDPTVEIHPLIGIPYNPYEPEPYNRWTMRGLFDLQHEILVANEMWDFLGGEGAYSDLLDCFEIAGINMRPELDAYFRRFQ